MLRIKGKKEEPNGPPVDEAPVDAPPVEDAPSTPDDAGAGSPDEDAIAQQIMSIVGEPSSEDAGGAKVDQATAVYMGPEQGPFACSNCTFFKAPNACNIVSGDIHPDGFCHIFTSMSNPTEAMGMEAPEGTEAPPEEPTTEEELTK